MAKRQGHGRDHTAPAAARILVGAVIGPHGIKGEVKVRSFTDKPEDIAAYGPLYDDAGERFEVRVRARAKGVVIAAIAGVTDRNGAERLRGTKLFVPRSALPSLENDEFYYSDLVGLRAELADGSALGVVTGVANFGASDVIEIAGDGGTLDLPFTREVIRAVDIESGRIVVALPEESESPQRAKPKRAARRGRARGK